MRGNSKTVTRNNDTSEHYNVFYSLQLLQGFDFVFSVILKYFIDSLRMHCKASLLLSFPFN